MRALNAIELFLVLMSLFFQSNRAREREGERKRRTREKKREMREMRERKVTQRHAREHRERAEREREKDRRLSTAAWKNFTSSS